MDFLTKDLVKSFCFSTMHSPREAVKYVVVNGRTYGKLGTYQAVTMVGNLYRVYDPDVESFKYMLMVGVAKQHPRDIKITKKEGYEVANKKAHISPSIVMEVSKDLTSEAFSEIAEMYMYTVMKGKLQFVKTPAELVCQCGEQTNQEIYQ